MCAKHSLKFAHAFEMRLAPVRPCPARDLLKTRFVPFFVEKVLVFSSEKDYLRLVRRFGEPLQVAGAWNMTLTPRDTASKA